MVDRGGILGEMVIFIHENFTTSKACVVCRNKDSIEATKTSVKRTAMFHLCRVTHSIFNNFTGARMAEGDAVIFLSICQCCW